MTTQLLPPVPYFGSKATIAHTIVALMPAHTHYVEPYAGSLAVLLAKPPSLVETVNDLDAQLVTFWRVLRDQPAELERVCHLTPHSRFEFTAAALEPSTSDLETARRVWVRLTQGRNGKTTSTGWRYHLDPADRSSLISRYMARHTDRIHAAAQRLRHVQLECLPALEIVDRYGVNPDTLIYADPPYLHETRSEGRGYRHEMSDEDHRILADALHQCDAAVILSGYRSPLYDHLYRDWYVEEIPTETTNGGTGKPTCEILWSNRPLGYRVQGKLWD